MVDENEYKLKQQQNGWMKKINLNQQFVNNSPLRENVMLQIKTYSVQFWTSKCFQHVYYLFEHTMQTKINEMSLSIVSSGLIFLNRKIKFRTGR